MRRNLLDVNVLLALSLPTHQHHAAVTTWFDAGREWATTAVTEAGYVRLMANPKVVGFDIPAGDAVRALVTMRGLAGHEFLTDDSTLTVPHVDLSRLVGTKQVTDFHLLNLAASRSCLLTTLDGSLWRAVAESDRQHLHLLAG